MNVDCYLRVELGSPGMVTHDPNLLLELLERWETLREQGTEPTAEELCREHPECLEPLRCGIAALKATSFALVDTDSQSLDAEIPRVPDLVAGRYRPVRLLGQGGYGLVWLAIDEELQRQVALKVPRTRRVLSGYSPQEFMVEARYVAGLHYPGIVAVHDMVREGDTCIIVSEYIEGVDLAVRLREGPIPLSMVVAIGIRVAEALSSAHGHGLIHRDIKPSNLLLDVHGEVHVCDFGIATSVNQAQSGRDCRLTLAYASPEQVHSDPVDHRTDIWSLGIVLFELLTGHLPFDAHDPGRMKKAIMLDPVPAVSHVPKALVKVIEGCLAKRPEDRYQSCQEVVRALQGVHAQPQRRRVGWLAGGAAVLVLAMAQYALYTMVPSKPKNLILNGDFTQGNTGFQTDYHYFRDHSGNNQSYCIISNPINATVNPSDKGDYGDHTTGDGLMMLVNGSLDSKAVVWSQKIPVMPGQRYDFNLWVSSWFALNPAVIDIRFNGVSVGLVNAPEVLGVWVPFHVEWDSGAADAVTIELLDVAPADIGSDFALDDISLSVRK